MVGVLGEAQAETETLAKPLETPSLTPLRNQVGTLLGSGVLPVGNTGKARRTETVPAQPHSVKEGRAKEASATENMCPYTCAHMHTCTHLHAHTCAPAPFWEPLTDPLALSQARHETALRSSPSRLSHCVRQPAALQSCPSGTAGTPQTHGRWGRSPGPLRLSRSLAQTEGQAEGDRTWGSEPELFRGMFF